MPRAISLWAASRAPAIPGRRSRAPLRDRGDRELVNASPRLSCRGPRPGRGTPERTPPWPWPGGTIEGASVGLDAEAAASPPMPEGTARAWPLGPIMVIGRAPSWLEGGRLAVLDRGRPVKADGAEVVDGEDAARPALGASSTHSTEERVDAYCTGRWYRWPVVVLVRETSQVSAPCSVMSTVTVSPGRTVSGTVSAAWGSVSIQAEYLTAAAVTVSSVPAWIRSRLSTPPIPTQAALTPAALSAPGWGTVQVPCTSVKGPPASPRSPTSSARRPGRPGAGRGRGPAAGVGRERGPAVGPGRAPTAWSARRGSPG